MEEAPVPSADELRALLADIAGCHIPYGMYGPAKYPPDGCPLMDLPTEYLDWFSQRGWPKGKLGRLMEQTLLIKNSGLDALFTPFRTANGGRRKYPTAANLRHAHKPTFPQA